ncbi:uncharacterized protein LOC110023290 [Phalaenopsis equestris]|uniref:uncharacterized protein LOC110023290 n=1 Tax=Phalaenopsis equestris TaxID=78828 RepID=UPI0009E3659D|nr:uncharacterized protein LOC110023290 [Phalaenopsis equestris]
MHRNGHRPESRTGRDEARGLSKISRSRAKGLYSYLLFTRGSAVDRALLWEDLNLVKAAVYCPWIGDSLIWKELLNVGNKAVEMFVWDLGEEKVNFWRDDWTIKGPLYAIYDDMMASNVTVSDFLNHDSWYMGKLNLVLNKEMVDYVVIIPFDTSKKDVLKCKFVGNHSVTKSIAKGLYYCHNQQNGNLIWNRFLKPSQSFLAWRMKFMFLPMDDILKRKVLKMTSICLLCR